MFLSLFCLCAHTVSSKFPIPPSLPSPFFVETFWETIFQWISSFFIRSCFLFSFLSVLSCSCLFFPSNTFFQPPQFTEKNFLIALRFGFNFFVGLRPPPPVFQPNAPFRSPISAPTPTPKPNRTGKTHPLFFSLPVSPTLVCRFFHWPWHWIPPPPRGCPRLALFSPSHHPPPPPRFFFSIFLLSWVFELSTPEAHTPKSLFSLSALFFFPNPIPYRNLQSLCAFARNPLFPCLYFTVERFFKERPLVCAFVFVSFPPALPECKLTL